MAKSSTSFKYSVTDIGIANLSLAIINQALKDLPSSKSFFMSDMFKLINQAIDINPADLKVKHKPIEDPKWIKQLVKRLKYNEMLPN